MAKQAQVLEPVEYSHKAKAQYHHGNLTVRTLCECGWASADYAYPTAHEEEWEDYYLHCEGEMG